ncbi:hypothetical protein IRB23SM22_09480 [Alkalibacterium sp. s-m-22]|uniref:Uncharacterized protein n=1 Tax=Alkalibacterium indicireducens TaxID=398758 RepID=A0ABN1AXY8_9LACT
MLHAIFNQEVCIKLLTGIVREITCDTARRFSIIIGYQKVSNSLKSRFMNLRLS